MSTSLGLRLSGGGQLVQDAITSPRRSLMDISGQVNSDLAASIAEWREWLIVERRCSQHTLSSYVRDVSQFCLFHTSQTKRPVCITDFGLLSHADIRTFLAHRREQGMSLRSLARVLAGIRSLSRFLADRGYLATSIPGTIKAPKIKKTLPRPLAIGEAEAVIGYCQQESDNWIFLRDTALFTLLWACGLRISEALSLKQEDAPSTSGTAYIRVTGKASKERQVPVLQIVAERIKTYVDHIPFNVGPGYPLFLGARGGVLSARVVQRTIEKIRTAAGLPHTATPHALRHSFATHLLSSGADLRSIQELLGHASLRTTQGYTAVDHEKMLTNHAKFHPRSKIRAG